MKLSEIFDQLRYGELAQLSLGESGVEGIEPENYPQIITHINMGLTVLHTRFPLLEEEVVIHQFAHISRYTIDVANALSIPVADRVTYPYIIDSEDRPFKNNLISIYSVYDENGDEYALNDSSSLDTIYTPAHNVIQVLHPVDTNAMFVTYRGNHALIPKSITEPESVEVNLPVSLMPALLAYVASRVHSSRASAEATQTGIVYLQKYEKICSEVEAYNTLHTSNQPTNNKLRESGWV